MKHKYYMEMALALAKKRQGFTSPNPVVGAVVVKNDRVIGKGFHEAAGKDHAEICAINDAGKDCEGADIYVSLEPCNHEGKTPPCTKKIIESGIKKVFVATKDPNSDVLGGGIDFLRRNGIEVVNGICEKKAKKINESFIKYIASKRPFVTVKCASTLDGRIATKTGDSRWITCEESREYVHMLRHYVDGIMVGINTVKRDNPSLTARLNEIESKDPVRFILDTKLSISKKAKVLVQASEAKTFIITNRNVSSEKKMAIESTGAEIITAPLTENGYISLEPLMKILGRLGITSLLIEGGSKLISSAFSAKIVDKVCFFYAPKILGSDDGVPVCTGQGPELIRKSTMLKDIEVKRFGDDVLIEGYTCLQEL